MAFKNMASIGLSAESVSFYIFRFFANSQSQFELSTAKGMILRT
jgi:hypothetical protein